jgi:thiamine pyrophosphate-dependent acetolactate synthase large subunit-like protein
VYVCLDAGMQEARLAEALPPIETARFTPPAPAAAPPDLIRQAAAMLAAAQRPVLLIGRVSRSLDAWNARVRLAETLGARAITDLKVAAAFPTEHPLHAGAPGLLLSAEAAEALRAADAILSLDWVDLAGTLQAVFAGPPAAKVVQVSVDHALHNGWSMDHQGLPPVDLFLAAEPDAVVPAVLAALRAPPTPARAVEPPAVRRAARRRLNGPIGVDDLALALRQAIGSRAASLLHLPLSWNGASWPFRHPLDYLGGDGGAGIGAGPGLAVGAALALKDTGRLPVAVCGDGDFLMGATALWTAVHYRIPLLVVVANNRSFYNDEVHQERIARLRGRPVENKWIGQRIADPGIDLAAMARAQGALGIGPVTRGAELARALADALAAIDDGMIVVIDVSTEPGPPPALAAAPAHGPK